MLAFGRTLIYVVEIEISVWDSQKLPIAWVFFLTDYTTSVKEVKIVPVWL